MRRSGVFGRCARVAAHQELGAQGLLQLDFQPELRVEGLPVDLCIEDHLRVRERSFRLRTKSGCRSNPSGRRARVDQVTMKCAELLALAFL